MASKLFVAGLAYAMTDDELNTLFADFGTVVSAQIITDRETGRSKGFGFVEMSTDDESKAAIDALNGKDMNGRPLTVNVARPREDRPARSFDDRRGSMGNNFRRSNR
ncbi:MAG TPA: RNA-binding protein [Patescibacteria group bacterium]|jgi:RNA recognition motif-containing protein|nr:RNA-binding protein [Patescibacteria group bacterium]